SSEGVPSTWWVTLRLRFLSSSGVIASAPYSSLNGVNLVVLDSDVLWDQMTFGSSSAHLPFFRSNSHFLMLPKMIPLALSTAPLDCGWYTEAKITFVPTL